MKDKQMPTHAHTRLCNFILHTSYFILAFLLATCHLPLATAQEIVTSTPIHNRAYSPSKTLFELLPAGNQTGDSQQWKNAAGAVITYVDKNGVLHGAGGVGPIYSINGLGAFAQFITVDCTSGTDVNIQPNIDTNAICFPDASATARGLVTTGAQVIGGPKTFTHEVIVPSLTIVGADSFLTMDETTCPTSDAGTVIVCGEQSTDQLMFSINGGPPIPVGGGTVTAVTGSLPIVSSGGPTPDISCPTCAVGFPRLDQVATQPVLADLTFAMGAHGLTFDFVDDGVNPSSISIISNSNLGFIPLIVTVTSSTSGTYPQAANITVMTTNPTGNAGDIVGLGLGANHSGLGAADSVTALSLSASGTYLSPTVTALKINDVLAGPQITHAITTGIGMNSFGDRLTVKSNAAAVQPVTFTGAGLNDATSGGTYTGLDDLAYCVQIDASVPSPDTFEWGTGGSCSNGATGVGITGAAQNLSNGVQITFAAIDGHTIGNNWTFTAFAPIPLTLQDHNGNITAKAKETGDWHSRRYFADTGTALVAGDFTTAGWQTGSGGLGTITGTDQAFQFTMTATDPNITLNPTVTLTFHDGTWTTAPVFVCSQNGGTGAQSFITVVPTATQAVITYLGTPVTTLTYIISCVGMGI